MRRPQDDRSAVFVDRDGVICENRTDHVKAWSEFAFLPGAADALASLTRAGVRLFVVTNQAIIARGLASRRTVDEINDRMVGALEEAGARVESVLVCPHDSSDRCACRKPEPGMLLDAAGRFDVDLSSSFLVGDAASDIEAGARAGCETVLVRTGRFATVEGATYQPAFVADDLVDAALWVLVRRAERLSSPAPADSL
jgi:D-glycero-D-manno-heptose 1,7-bisphosphate phosphatase